MPWPDFKHRIGLRVRWAEADMQGVVFNGHYLTYCDVCITEYWRAVRVRYPEDFVTHGGDALALAHKRKRKLRLWPRGLPELGAIAAPAAPTPPWVVPGSCRGRPRSRK